MSFNLTNNSRHSWRGEDDDLLSYAQTIQEDEEANFDHPSVVRIAESSDAFSSNNYGSSRSNSYGSLNSNSAEDVNKLRITQALASTGLNSSGIVIVEAWVMNDKKTCLKRPDGAIWSDPSYKPPSRLDEETCHEAMRKLQDPRNKGYTPPYPMQPGIGFAGKLWAEKTMKRTTKTSDSVPRNKKPTSTPVSAPKRSIAPLRSTISSFGGSGHSSLSGSNFMLGSSQSKDALQRSLLQEPITNEASSDNEGSETLIW